MPRFLQELPSPPSKVEQPKIHLFLYWHYSCSIKAFPYVTWFFCHLLPILSTDLCKAALTQLLHIKTKYHNRLDVKHDLHWNTRLVDNLQHHPSYQSLIVYPLFSSFLRRLLLSCLYQCVLYCCSSCKSFSQFLELKTAQSTVCSLCYNYIHSPQVLILARLWTVPHAWSIFPWWYWLEAHCIRPDKQSTRSNHWHIQQRCLLGWL